MEINITWYSDDLRPQVIKLFAEQYGIAPADFNRLFERFYFHPFQKNKCLLVVAMDENTVAGFQSFFYWPYFYEEKKYNSFQSGNSLVNPAYRGKGIFNKMLAFIDHENKTANIDFLMGFPVEASLKNFLKDKWQNILNLQWYVKLCNPFGFLPFNGGSLFIPGCLYFDQPFADKDVFSLLQENDFTNWRNDYLSGTYYTFKFKEGSNEILFHLKLNKRKKILHELVIGNILFNNAGAKKHLSAALKKLSAAAARSFGVHFLSIAVNEKGLIDLNASLQATGFRRTGKSIYFIVKPFGKAPVTDPGKWLLFRSDIDTW